MEPLRSSSSSSLLLCTLVTALLISLYPPAVPALSTPATFEDQKNYYSPDPGAGPTRPPSGGSHRSPPHHGNSPSHGSGGGSHGGSPPSHGGGGGGSYDPTPSTPPSHGGGSYNPTPSTPPSNCGIPPPRHDPSTPSTPSNPSAPSTPSNQPPPSGSGGGYYNNPPPSGGGNTYTPPSTPTTPDYGAPPTTPILPGTPSTPTIPSPPFTVDPNFPFIGTCNYWRTHPQVVWGVLGFWTTMGNAFGVPNIPGGGANLNLLEALSNPRKDGLGSLYREGTAAFLNSMVNSRFPFTTKQVRGSFVSALGSNKAATNQARVFKLANEGKLKPRN